MLVGVIGDAHGNDEGLELCLRHLRGRGCEKLIFLGDAIGYFQRGETCCRMLMEAGALCLMGNHEAMLRGELPIPENKREIVRLPISWEALPEAWRNQVTAHGPRLELALGGRRLLCVHGSPHAPLTGYVLQGALAELDFDADVLIMGHTHRPFVEHTRRGLALNPGSCGLPRDRGDLLSLAVLDLTNLTAEVTRIPFTPSSALLNDAHNLVRECMKRRAEGCFGHMQSERK